jgi:hypothetical protein
VSTCLDHSGIASVGTHHCLDDCSESFTGPELFEMMKTNKVRLALHCLQS